jgi:hypothetical protein
MPTYEIRRGTVDAAAMLDDPAWEHAAMAGIAHARPESRTTEPRANVRLLYDDERIHGLFEVHDVQVLCVHEGFGASVWKDSCVEFFVEPHPGAGYCNFEFNCGGSWLVKHITDPVRVAPARFRAFRDLGLEDVPGVRVVPTMPPRTEPAVAGPLDWRLAFSIPFDVLARAAGARVPRPGDRWRGNFYKCGDDTPAPHWIAWSPVDEMNFHLPRCFGDLVFAR